MIRTYSMLCSIPTFKERYEYLKLSGTVGEVTYGFDRIINQEFYRSQKWKTLRNWIILRDKGCNLAFDGYEIYGKIIIHHLNPISLKDIEHESDFLLNPEYLICTDHRTHQAIHYGDENLLPKPPVQRSKNDTCPWKKA